MESISFIQCSTTDVPENEHSRTQLMSEVWAPLVKNSGTEYIWEELAI